MKHEAEIRRQAELRDAFSAGAQWWYVWHKHNGDAAGGLIDEDMAFVEGARVAALIRFPPPATRRRKRSRKNDRSRVLPAGPVRRSRASAIMH